MSLEEIEALQGRKKALVRAEEESNIEARIALIDSIEVIANNAQQRVKTISNIRATRATETKRKHIDFVGGLKND